MIVICSPLLSPLSLKMLLSFPTVRRGKTLALDAEDLRRWARTDPAQSDHVTGADGWGLIWFIFRALQ